MDITEEVLKEMEKRNRVHLDDGIYGLDHELIGKPCLYRGSNFHSARDQFFPAIPYGAYRLDEEAEIHVADYKQGKPLLAILYYAENDPCQGIEIKVKGLSAVSSDDLIPLDPNSQKAREIHRAILGWLENHKMGSHQAGDYYKKKYEPEIEKLKEEIEQLKKNNS